MNEIKDELYYELRHTEPEISSVEIFCLALFVMIVGFVVGFMAGVSC